MDLMTEIESLNPIITRERRPLYPYLMSHKDLIESEIPPRKFITASWMPQDSIGMVFAPRGVGKTWFCMALAVAISEGHKQFLGWEIHEQHRVLYVDGEMAMAELKERFASLSASPSDNLYILPSELLYRDGNPICLDETEEQFAVDILLGQLSDEGRRPQIIILDNLSTLRRHINENDNSEAQKLLDWLVALRHRGFAVIVVHHAGKSGQQRGASIIEVPMDYIIHLKEPDPKKHNYFPGQTKFVLSFSKVRGIKPQADDILLALQKNDKDIMKLCSEQHLENCEPYIHLLRYLAQNGHCSQRMLRDKLGFSIGKVNQCIAQLKKDDLLQPSKGNVPNDNGLRLLHEFWPEEFELPERFRYEQDDIPF